MRMNTAIVEVDRPWLAMSSMLIGAFVGMLSETSLNIALPTLGRVFSVGTGTLQWLVTGYMLMIGIVLPFSSLISKWFSTRQIIIFALADFTVGALISGFANSFGMLLFGRMIQGIGTGLILPLMFTVADLPAEEAGTCDGHQRTCHHVCTGNRTDRHGHRPRIPLMACRLLHVCNHFTCRTSFCLHRSEERQPHHPSED